MWQTILNFIKQVFTLAEIETTLKEHSRQINELTANQTRFYYELQLQKERATHEREKEAMQRENQQLRAGWNGWRSYYPQPQPTKSRMKSSGVVSFTFPRHRP